MVKSSDYEKDIRAISEKVGTAVFTYDEIHNEDVGSKYKYDYQKVIDEVSRLNGCDMTEELLERGILSILPDGEYKVNVGSTTKGGGGLNYGGTAFFSYDKSDISTHYHELAHSLQKHYNLFDENMLDEIYNESGNDLNDKEKEEKLIDRYTYSHYLNEMHSESFAYAARMLRADNWWEFTKEAVVAYSNGIMSNSVGFLDPRKKYGSNPALKYYSSYPVMKETIKQIYDIRKQKKLGEYFDENGIINDEKTARLAENIVKEKGYSPRTLNSYFNYNALDRHKDNEHGWRRDSLKSLVIFLPTLVLETSTTLKEFADFVQSRVKHLELSAREKFMVNKFLLSPISKNKSPEEKALEAYQKIRIKCSIADEKYENSYMGIHLLDRLDNALDKGGYPQAYLNNFSDIISNYTTFFNKSRYEAGFRHTSRYVNKLIKENKDNPYFKSLIKGQVNDFDLQKMIIEKKKDKNKQVIPLDLEAKRDKSGFAHIPIRFMVKTVEEFSDKYNISKDIKDKMLKAVVNEPEIFENKEFRKQMFNQIKPNDFLSTIKGTTGSMRTDFYKAMDKVASSYFSIEGKDKFMKPLSELKNVAPDDLLSTIETKLEDEREAYRLS
ncbi:MAG: hypothetical protein IKW39_01305, partial [Alphaproteobacteria bacterium]|nr:hypothetical protein [Alphaproteobacteria bacterium]